MNNQLNLFITTRGFCACHKRLLVGKMAAVAYFMDLFAKNAHGSTRAHTCEDLAVMP